MSIDLSPAYFDLQLRFADSITQVSQLIMTELHLFKWGHFQADIILLCVRWSLRSAPELERRCRPHVKPTTDSWRVDETYIKVKKQWVYLYRAIDSQGNTLDCFFSPTRNAETARCFFLKAVAASHTTEPRVINVDKNVAYAKVFVELKAEGKHYLS
jgi:transposase, IS6 family